MFVACCDQNSRNLDVALLEHDLALLVVALNERVGAVADADDGDPDLLLLVSAVAVGTPSVAHFVLQMMGSRPINPG